jgi:hypothetical protein
VKTVAVFERLLNGCIDHGRVRRANCVGADNRAAAISLDDASQIFTRSVGHRGAICLEGIRPLIHRLRIIESGTGIRFTEVESMK